MVLELGKLECKVRKTVAEITYVGKMEKRRGTDKIMNIDASLIEAEEHSREEKCFVVVKNRIKGMVSQASHSIET